MIASNGNLEDEFQKRPNLATIASYANFTSTLVQIRQLHRYDLKCVIYEMFGCRSRAIFRLAQKTLHLINLLLDL